MFLLGLTGILPSDIMKFKVQSSGGFVKVMEGRGSLKGKAAAAGGPESKRLNQLTKYWLLLERKLFLDKFCHVYKIWYSGHLCVCVCVHIYDAILIRLTW